MNHDQNDFRACIELCRQCSDICEATLYNHCLPMGGRHTAPAHVRVMADCIQMCQTCADFLTRGSDLHMATCLACADICDACAISCEQVGGREMLACAEICQRCGHVCRDMSHAHAAMTV